MGIARGPNVINDGLVFGYDTGYPISDNDTATRFSPGKPAVNLVPDAYTMAGWSAYSAGNDGTFVTEFGTTGHKIINTASWNGLYKDITLPSTGVYTFSAWFRLHQSSTGNNGATVYISGWGGSDTATAIDRSKIGEWQRIEKTITVTDVTLRYYLISYGGSNATSSWEVHSPQLEIGSTASPFVDGSRSATQSLIDLKRTASISANVSFGSDGQPVFDGSSDHIVTPFNRGTLGDTLTMIAYYKYTGGSSRTYTPIFGGIESSTEFFIGKNSGNTSIGVQDGNYNGGFVTGSNAWDGNYHQLVYTYENGTGKIYLDGVLKSSGSFTKCNTAEVISVGRESEGGGYYFLGDIPRACVYNKVFSASEILQDFNANKNRFNI